MDVALLASLTADLVSVDVSRDGDCIESAAALAAALSGHLTDVQVVDVAGWLDFQGVRCIGFMHRAALVDGTHIVDLTATQFAAELPKQWIALLDDYTTALAAVTGCQVEVSITH